MIHNPRCYRTCGAPPENRATPGITPQEGQQPPSQGGEVAGESASEGEAPAAGFPAQNRACNWCATYDTIYHEDLQVANMLKNHHLAKSIRMRVERGS